MVRSDFKYVFKDIMDRQHFEDNMFFSDPISRVTFFRGIAGSPPAVEHCSVYCHPCSLTDVPEQSMLRVG